MGSREIITEVTERLRARSAVARAHYLELMHETAARYRQDSPQKRVALISAEPEADASDREPELVELVSAAGGTAHAVVRLPALCQGFAATEEGARERRTLAAECTIIGLSQGRFDLVLAPEPSGDGAAGVLIGCLRCGHLPVLFMPEAVSSGVVTRPAFETQVLIAALRLYDPQTALPTDPVQRREHTRVAVAAALSTPPSPLAELLDEQAVVQGMLALLAISASRPRLRALVGMARAAGYRIQRSDITDLARALPGPQSFGNALDGPTRPLAVVRTLRARGVLGAR